jgi:NADH dehydrogenase/NADH:ubiquinone oxidoreductase subunit G
VEISKPEWGEWKGLVTACLYTVEEGLVVETDSDTVRRSRADTLDLLLARCPDTPQIKSLAADYGVFETSYKPREEDDHCILCGICTRICSALGHNAISIVNRGENKEVATPFKEPTEECVGCGACARNCPTGAIAMEETGGERRIWGRTFEMVSCSECNQAYITREQMKFLCDNREFEASYFESCDACRRKEISKTFAEIVRW